MFVVFVYMHEVCVGGGSTNYLELEIYYYIECFDLFSIKDSQYTKYNLIRFSLFYNLNVNKVYSLLFKR